MRELWLIGIGTGNPDHLTGEGRKAILGADLVLVPRKGADKSELADIRLQILDEVMGEQVAPRIAEFDLPKRGDDGDYRAEVDLWHDAIAEVWSEAIAEHGDPERVALLIWGDPSLYDSSLRIAARLHPQPKIRVVPGITALQALTAAHAIPLNEIASPVMITTGRRLRDEGWPEGVDRIAVMLDGNCAFQHLPPDGLTIWWGAYVGMEQQILCSGPVSDVTETILQRRAQARAEHGWIMDIYLLQRQA